MAGNKRRRTGEGFRTTGGDHLNVPSQSSTSQPTFLSTFDRESRYPIFNALCDCLSIAEIVFLTQTCKKLSGLYQYLLPVQWDIDKALRRYVDDPYGFRSQMAKHDALIFGYFATEYFDRVLGKCKTLEVAVRQGLGSELFRKYLLDVAGYEEVKFTKFDQNHHLTTTEVCMYATIFPSGNLAKQFAISDPGLQEKCRQQD